MRYAKIQNLKKRNNYAVKLKNLGIIVSRNEYNLEIILIKKEHGLESFIPKSKTYLFIGDREFLDGEIRTIMTKMVQYLEVFVKKESFAFVKNNFTEIVYNTFAKIAYSKLSIRTYKDLLKTIENYLLSFYKRDIKKIDTLPLSELKDRIEEVITRNRLLFLNPNITTKDNNYKKITKKIMQDLIKLQTKKTA